PSYSFGSYTGKTVRVDSVEIFYFHNRTLTTKPDTFNISVFNVNQASVTGSGPNANLVTTPLWQQTLNITGNSSLNAQGVQVAQGIFSKTFPVNVTLPQGVPFGVRINYQGDTTNKFYLIRLFRDDCNNTCLYANSTVPDNSIAYINYTIQNNNLSGLAPLAADCNSNNQIESSACELLYCDFWVIAYVSITGPTCIPSSSSQGYSPKSANIPCAINGQTFGEDITFTVPSTILNFPINSVRIDSIRNLPTGLTATLNQNPPVYAGGTNGCFRIQGTPNAPCGQYKLLVYVTVTGAFGTQSGELSALASQFNIPGYEPIFIRVVNQNITCPPVNNSQTANFAPINCQQASINVTITKTDVICTKLGSATANPSGGSNYTYLWNTGATTQTISNLGPGTYTVTVTETNLNVTATASVTIVAQASTLTVSAAQGTQPGCGQNNGTAVATANGGTPPYTYAWNTVPPQNTATAVGLSSGSYTVTVTDNNGCTASATATLSNPNAPNAAISGNNSICLGKSTTLVASGGGTYSWSNNLGSNASVTVTPTTTTTYSVTVTGGNGCSASASITVTVRTPSITVLNQNICQGQSFSFNGQQLTQSGTYKDTLVNAQGCDSIITLELTVHPLPNPVITQNGNVLTTGNFASYQWQLNGNNIPGATSQSYTPTQSGTYTVVVFNAQGCSNTSAPFNYTGVGFESVNALPTIRIFPNPNNGNFTVMFSDSDVYDVKITNLLGETVWENKQSKNQEMIALPDAPKGLYLIYVRKGQMHSTWKFSLMK
ncbi:MAG: T9SS type A sorting domain-containing protein, partial [Chitinophagales bacterium]|nr:T9SS type A sorting domain-containing protein [Chitinophagales bacterium]